MPYSKKFPGLWDLVFSFYFKGQFVSKVVITNYSKPVKIYKEEQ